MTLTSLGRAEKRPRNAICDEDHHARSSTGSISLEDVTHPAHHVHSLSVIRIVDVTSRLGSCTKFKERNPVEAPENCQCINMAKMEQRPQLNLSDSNLHCSSVCREVLCQ